MRLHKAPSPAPLYQCFNCKWRWEDEAGMVSCPKCGSIYCLWLNYALWEENKRKR